MATGTAVTEQARVGSAVASNGAGPQDVPEIVTFPDLVRAHRAWEVELYGCARESREPDRTLEHEFRRKWGQFETKYGQIKNAYWSVRDASAVAFSVKKRRRTVRVWGHEHIPRFHRVTDWATRDEPQVAKALDDCESLAVRVEEILRGPSELIALRRINAVASQLLGYVDREWGRQAPPATAGLKPPDWVHQAQCKEFVNEQRSELAEVASFYKRTGEGQGKILFFWGMVQGLLVLALVTALTVGLDVARRQPRWRPGALGRAAALHHQRHGRCAGRLPQRAAANGVDRRVEVHPRFRGRACQRALARDLPSLRRWASSGSRRSSCSRAGSCRRRHPGSDRDYAYYGILAFFSGFFERFTKLPTEMPSVGETGAAAKADKAETAAGAGKAQSGA